MLSVECLDLHYGAAQALRGVSVSATAGAVTCVLGRNGVGKTSLWRAICGQQKPSKGRIVWQGEDISTMQPHERARRGIAFVPQGREIFPLLSVKENIETGFAPLKRVDRKIPEYVFELFPVLKSMLRRRGGDLSGGQQQQLAIARALAAGPRLLMLDEPTEGIQPSIIKDIGRALQKLAREGLDGRPMAVLLVEQYYDFAEELADQYLVMERGEVVMRGRGADMPADGVKARLAI